MKIIKQFESNDFARSQNVNFYWSWGLGDDGFLYGKGRLLDPTSRYTYWHPYADMTFGIPLSEMKKIVKEFGHLLLFI